MVNRQVGLVIVLLCGLVAGWLLRQPGVKTEIQERRIYDLTQSLEIIEAYYNAAGRASIGKTELDKIKAEEWGAGYWEGYQKALRR